MHTIPLILNVIIFLIFVLMWPGHWSKNSLLLLWVVFCHHQFSFTGVTESVVFRAVRRFTSNAVGANNILIRFIKDSLSVMPLVITSIFNKSLVCQSQSLQLPGKSLLNVHWPLQTNILPTIISNPSVFMLRCWPITGRLECLERIVSYLMSSYIEHNKI